MDSIMNPPLFDLSVSFALRVAESSGDFVPGFVLGRRDSLLLGLSQAPSTFLTGFP